jgi:hypothetical protein
MATSPDPKKLQEVKKLLDEIAKGYDTLRQKNPFAKFDTSGIQDVDQTISQLEVTLDGLNHQVENFTDNVSESYNAFRSIVSEVGNLNKGLSETRKSYNLAASAAQKIRDHELGISNLSSKQLKQVKAKLESSKQNLKSATALLQEEKAKLLAGRKYVNLQGHERKKYKEINDLINDNNRNLATSAETYGKANDQIDAAILKEKQLEKQLGITGGVLKGMSKIPIIGDLFDTTEALEEMEDVLRKGGSSTEALGAGFKNMGSQIKGQILNPANLMTMAFTQLLAALQKSDKEAGEMAKGMNMTYSEALNTRQELGNMAALSGDAALNTKGLQETYMAIGQSLGSNAKLNEKDLITATKLREQAGYTNEQLVELNKLSAVNGKSIEQNTKEILGGAEAYASRKGLVLNEKQILDDVAKSSASLKLSLGGSADALAKSAVQARAVGVNLEMAASMADQLLQFESSIENELSAELLTGKDLNFERARTLALNNDIAGAAEEIANQVGTSADFAKMNAIQQEAIAKAAGMTKDQLAQSLMDREALTKLSGVEGKDAKEKFDNLVKQVGMEEAKKRLGNEQLANQFAQQSVQERFNQTVEKLQEIFVNVAGALMPILDIFSEIFGVISSIISSTTGLATVLGGLGGLMLTKLIPAFGKLGVLMRFARMQGIGAAILAVIKGAWESLGGLPVVGPVLAGAAIAGGIALVNSYKADDMISKAPGGSPGYGKRTLFGPEGAIQLNNKDTVIAGTNLFDNSSKADDMMSAPKGALQVSNSTAPKKEVPVDTSAATNSRLDALIAATGKVNSIPTLRIQ